MQWKARGLQPCTQRRACLALLTRLACAVVLGWLVSSGMALAQQANPNREGATPSPKLPTLGVPNVATPTLGGKQLWGDEMVVPGWRIQRHVLTGHFRLLDANDRRHTWGTFAQCHGALQAFAKKTKPRAVDGDVVLLLHGLARSRSSMRGLNDYLAEHSRMTPLMVGYPSTRAEIDQHAQALDRVIAHLPKAKRLHFVAHSLGNIVIRRYLAMHTDPATGRKPDPRIGHIVMLCPPNHGATAAEMLSPSDISRAIGGSAITELGENWAKFESKLVTPASPFGVLAGGRGDGKGYNKLIEGDDDLVIGVATTRLAGADDFRVLPIIHTFFMDDPTVRQHTHHFLEHGNFEGADKCQPIVAEGARR